MFPFKYFSQLQWPLYSSLSVSEVSDWWTLGTSAVILILSHHSFVCGNPVIYSMFLSFILYFFRTHVRNEPLDLTDICWDALVHSQFVPPWLITLLFFFFSTQLWFCLGQKPKDPTFYHFFFQHFFYKLQKAASSKTFPSMFMHIRVSRGRHVYRSWIDWRKDLCTMRGSNYSNDMRKHASMICLPSSSCTYLLVYFFYHLLV